MAAIYAHRGARAVAPENTLIAFQTALDLGADGIELDVQLSKDGTLVVLHDFSVERTTDGHGKISDLTAAEICSFDAGSHFAPEFAGARIPTLDEVLDLVGDRCRLNIEIKTVDFRGGDEVDVVADTIAARGLYEQVIISSFNPVSLIKMRHVDARVALGLLYHDELPSYLLNAWLGALIHPEALHPHYRLIDEAFMIRARSLDKAVNTWTVNDVEEARRLESLGVNVIITDDPAAIMAGLATST
jgi:glycerophosphoryl diester phosphodiesterase